MPSPSLSIEHRVTLGTDGASFQLFHPADKPARGWLTDDFMIRKDFAAGRLISFGTGSDGVFTFRITSGPLSERERGLVCCQMEFRLVVRHGSVLLDNACDYDSFAFDIPIGSYRVTVSSIAWDEEEGAEDRPGDQNAPSFVIQFEAIDRIESIPAPDAEYDIRNVRKWKPYASRPRPYQPPAPPEVELYPVIRTPRIVVTPFLEHGLPISPELRDRLEADQDFPRPGIVLHPTDRLPCLASLVREEGTYEEDGVLRLFVQGRCLVQARALVGVDSQEMVRVKAFVSDRSDAPAEQFASLLAAYGEYVRAGKPRERRQYVVDAEYDIESIRAMTSHDQVVWDLLQSLPIADRDRPAIARGSVKEQVELLTKWLRAAP